VNSECSRQHLVTVLTWRSAQLSLQIPHAQEIYCLYVYGSLLTSVACYEIRCLYVYGSVLTSVAYYAVCCLYVYGSVLTSVTYHEICCLDVYGSVLTSVAYNEIIQQKANICHSVTKTSMRLEVKFSSFLILALNGGDWSDTQSGSVTPDTKSPLFIT
jgi:hypothetical protein